jgi:hypothetical protein
MSSLMSSAGTSSEIAATNHQAKPRPRTTSVLPRVRLVVSCCSDQRTGLFHDGPVRVATAIQLQP